MSDSDVTPDVTPDSAEDSGSLEASRRDKLQKLTERGIDPWGGRFDDRQWIRDIRAAASEIKFRTEDGNEVSLPDIESLTADGERFDMRQWRSGLLVFQSFPQVLLRIPNPVLGPLFYLFSSV